MDVLEQVLIETGGSFVKGKYTLLAYGFEMELLIWAPGFWMERENNGQVFIFDWEIFVW